MFVGLKCDQNQPTGPTNEDGGDDPEKDACPDHPCLAARGFQGGDRLATGYDAAHG